jgi:hypothetical protein
MCSWRVAQVSPTELGELLSGIGTIVIAVIASIISLQQYRKQWFDDFRTVYAEFWNDKEATEVRRWISSRKQYDDVLKPVLVRRNQQKENNLEQEDNVILDKLDKFLSIMVRLQVAEKIGMPVRRRLLVTKLLFSKYWIAAINSRSELVTYVEENWREEIDLEVSKPSVRCRREIPGA